MSTIKKALTRQAVKTTARHSAHGTASRLKRNPVRTVTLLSLGGALGALAGFMAGRSSVGTASASTGS